MQSSPVALAGADRSALALVSSLCRALEADGVRYCHWKSNESVDRSATGENDLDLLVSRRDAQRFAAILRRLGFKSALLAPEKELPGVFHAYGLDEPSGKLVHVHAHYQLVLGDDMTKNYRLPIEEAYLASARAGELFRIPTPEMELAVFLVRMVLKHATWDAMLSFQGSLTASEKRELASLTGQADLARMRAQMKEALPFFETDLWDACRRAVSAGSSTRLRASTARRLQRNLAGHGRRPHASDVLLKLWRRGRAWLRRHLLGKASPRKRLDSGGAIIAIVGGDGAGKSTAVDGLQSWLAEGFDTVCVHLGKPSRSVVSRLANSVWEMGRGWRRAGVSGEAALKGSPTEATRLGFRAFARLVWEVMTARDRYLEYVRARRLATNGTLVICDRYPLPQIKLMDGAAATRLLEHGSAVVRALARREKWYYDQVRPPEILIVLKVHPDTAVERKRDEEGEAFVRPRSQEIWGIDWRGTSATVIDAGRPRAEVLSQIKSLVWSGL